MDINVMLSTLNTENPNDYGWNALGEAVGTFGSYKISDIKFYNKYGNIIFKPFLSEATGEFLGDSERYRDNINKLMENIRLTGDSYETK